MKKNLSSPSFICFLAGGLLALMVTINGQLAHHSNVLLSSLMAHGIGGLFGLALIPFLKDFKRIRWAQVKKLEAWTWWGGVLGAFVVICSSYAFNSKLGTSGTLALLIAGQVVLSLVIDQWGLFKMPKIKAGFKQVLQVILICAGAAIIIFGARA